MTINPSGSDFLVNDTAAGIQSAGENNSSVAVSDTGTVAAYAGLGAGTREGIFLRSYDLDGAARGPAVLASSTIQGTRTAASVAANAVGDTVVVWQGRGRGDKYGIFMQRHDADGLPRGDEQLVNETVGGRQHDPAVAMAPDGSFVISWTGPTASDTLGVFLRRFGADGAPLAGQSLVNSTVIGDQIESAVAVGDDGQFIVTWSSRDQDGDDWGVFAQRFNADGVPQGTEFAVNTTTTASQRESSVARQADGSFMVVWSSLGQDGESWAVVGQRFDSSGVAVGDEFIINTTSAGHQRHARVAGAGGNYLVTWQSGVADGSGWEVKAQQLDAVGNRVGDEQAVNSAPAGVNSGHQRNPAAALSGTGRGAVIWVGNGSADRQGVFGRSFQDDAPAEENLSPDLDTFSSQTVAPHEELLVSVTATDPNAGDTLTYQLDPTTSPVGATIERVDNNNATIRWTPTDTEQNSVFVFRVLVTDDGTPPLADAEEFEVTVTDGALVVDLNGSDQAGLGHEATFYVGGDAVSIVDDDLLVVGAEFDRISSATATLNTIRNAGQEFLSVTTFDTNITPEFNANLRTLTLQGEDTQENYQRVLRTLTYENTAANARLPRVVEITVDDGVDQIAVAEASITIGTADLVGFAQALAASETQFFGAAWCPHCTDQKELFEDGGQFLPFIEVTNPDRSLNDIGIANEIETFPTWVFSDGSRLEGTQSLATLSARSGVAIPVSDDPFVAPLPDAQLLVSSPLHVPLDGYDPNGGPLTYSVSTNNAAVTAEIVSGDPANPNRSARVNVAGFGDLVFELFEERATRATDRFIELAEDDFYNGLIFHRIDPDFVIQGGDPLGTGAGGSTLGNFDDDFDVDLQHNRAGLLSYAKSTPDDTNDSQFFITDNGNGPLRNLDFNHSIFGILKEGEGNRQAIRDTELDGESPVIPVVMEDIEIFQDTENAVLLLKADSIPAGPVTVTVSVSDQQGNTFERSFEVTVANDTVNSRPFLDDIAPVTTTTNTPVEIQLVAIDAEGAAEASDAVYEAVVTGAVDFAFDLTDDGLLTATPPTDFVGTLEILVAVRPFVGGDFDSQLVSIEVT